MGIFDKSLKNKLIIKGLFGWGNFREDGEWRKIKEFQLRGLFVWEGEVGDFDRVQVFYPQPAKIASPHF